ncbi:MAG: hypothetical protein GF309_09155 [Candidatus Lokiarchaeota archaeon]|nr:hypothetical protein [Candidatus Lokiarchaeota archaeon]
MTRTLDEVMRFLDNYTMAWHHWLILLSLLKLGGSATKKQIFPVFKKEGFSPHAIEGIFKRDLEELGEAVEVEGGLDNLNDSSMIYLTEDKKFRAFLKRNLKSVVRTLKQRKTK